MSKIVLFPAPVGPVIANKDSSFKNFSNSISNSPFSELIFNYLIFNIFIGFAPVKLLL